MQRRILIIDDHDDLATSLKEVFCASGHDVKILQSREDASALKNIESFDLVITDLDCESPGPDVGSNGHVPVCIPELPAVEPGERVKAFKISATNFRRHEFDEAELRHFVETILNYKCRFVDKKDFLLQLHEKIEFELPSAISPMHSILDYLTRRVEKLGVVRPEQSNLFVALDEAFVNAVKHGNKFNADKLIRIIADVTPQEARFTIEDEGEGFDINSIPDPRDPTNLFKSSGRGVLFIYNIMDEVEYNERGNRLTMIKRSEVTDPASKTEDHKV
jgi:serine/threonine-protein kinase RsbW